MQVLVNPCQGLRPGADVLIVWIVRSDSMVSCHLPAPLPSAPLNSVPPNSS